MSYDLVLYRKAQNIDEAEFNKYFSERTNYTVQEKQAFYENESTGVYFSFTLEEADSDTNGDIEAESSSCSHVHILFNINYVRPSFFALEAAEELGELVDALRLLIDDLQMNGMRSEHFSKQAFVQSWTVNNQDAIACIFETYPEEKHKLPTLPTDKLQQIWAWNAAIPAKDVRFEQCGEDVFVPHICCVEEKGHIHSAIIWPDGIPVHLPHFGVDKIIVVRELLAAKRWLRKTAPDRLSVDWQILQPFIARYDNKDYDDAYHLSYPSPPDDLGKFIRALPVQEMEATLYSWDKVIDR